MLKLETSGRGMLGLSYVYRILVYPIYTFMYISRED